MAGRTSITDIPTRLITQETDVLASVLHDYGIKPQGVVHAGAYDCAEAEHYAAMGFENVLFFEPNTDVHERASENLRAAFRKHAKTRFVLSGKALADYDGMGILHQVSHDQANSLFPMAAVCRALYPDFKEAGEKMVPCAQFDNLAVDTRLYNVLVMDIQGAELRALIGAENFVRRQVEVLQLEINVAEMYEGCGVERQILPLLDEWGFQMVKRQFDYSPAWGEAWFVKRGVQCLRK
jgi:FkbM family methyltransferase